MFLDFKSEQDVPGVTSKDLATELDWYADWTVNDNFTLSFVAAFASPGKAVEAVFDRNEDFWYGWSTSRTPTDRRRARGCHRWPPRAG
jgi:hypothetical protein